MFLLIAKVKLIFLNLIILWSFLTIKPSKPLAHFNSTKVLRTREKLQNISTVATFIIDRSYITPTYRIDNENLESDKLKFDFWNDFIQIDYEKNKVYLLGILFLFLITPLGILLWLFKLFGKSCLLRFCCKQLFKGKKRNPQMI